MRSVMMRRDACRLSLFSRKLLAMRRYGAGIYGDGVDLIGRFDCLPRMIDGLMPLRDFRCRHRCSASSQRSHTTLTASRRLNEASRLRTVDIREFNVRVALLRIRGRGRYRYSRVAPAPLITSFRSRPSLALCYHVLFSFHACDA